MTGHTTMVTSLMHLQAALRAPAMADDEMEEEVVSVQGLSISPNNCPLDEPLDLVMDFSITRDLPAARWEVKVRLVADSAPGGRTPEHAAAATGPLLNPPPAWLMQGCSPSHARPQPTARPRGSDPTPVP